MKKILLLVLSVPLLSIAVLAQTPSPSEANTPSSSINQAKSSPSPGPTTQVSLGMTLIKWGDFQVTTSDYRVVALLGGLTLLGFVGSLILKWRLGQHKARGVRSPLFSKGIVIISIVTLILFGTTLLLFGIWLGGRSARSEVQQYIDAHRLTVSQGQPSQTPVPTPSPTPQPTPQPSPTLQASPTLPTSASDQLLFTAASSLRQLTLLIVMFLALLQADIMIYFWMQFRRDRSTSRKGSLPKK